MADAVVAAGKVIRNLRNPMLLQLKVSDMVTEADILSARIIEETLRRIYPNDAISAEDREHLSGTSGYEYIVDPIDGTKNYFMNPMQVPMYSVSIALRYGDQIVAGVVFHPPVGDLYYAIIGGGSFGISISNQDIVLEELRSLMASAKELNVRNQKTEIPQILFETPSNRLPRQLQDTYWRQIAEINRTYRTRALGCGSLSICYVAGCNDIAAAVDFSGTTKPYDVLAAELIARESGATVKYLPIPHSETVRYVVAKPDIWEGIRNIVV